MDDEKDLDKKLAEFDERVTPRYLLKLHKLNLAKKINAGETGLFEEFRKLKELEKQTALETSPEAAAKASSPQPASSPIPGEAGASSSPQPSPAGGEGDESEEIGIPARLRVKRQYTLSPAALEARRKNSQQPRPGSEGNKRNWKGGRFAKDFILGRIKPCQSTCPIFDECELVSEGYTKPDGICLDKSAVITTYAAIMDAVKDKDHDDFNEVSGLMVAETMHVARMLMEDIMRDGSVVKRERYDKEGRLQLIEYVSHPSLMALPKLIADLGLTPRELNITPKAIKDDKNSEEQGKTLAGIMSDLNRRQRDRQGPQGEGSDE